ncbi:MAG: hypothetical protein ABSC50_02575 [Candidatus Bathyarchaeia archaeon]
MPERELSEPEKRYWSYVSGLTIGLLTELKDAGLLNNEREWDLNTVLQLDRMTGRFNGHMETAKALTEAVRSKSREITECLKNLDVGFNESNVGEIWFNDMVSVFTESSEMLKSYFLLILRTDGTNFRTKMTLGDLFRGPQSIAIRCPRNGPKFAAEINIDLRNAFSHGVYWWVRGGDGNLWYLGYAKKLGDKELRVPIHKINDAIAKQNTLTACFVETLGIEAKSGYFKNI